MQEGNKKKRKKENRKMKGRGGERYLVEENIRWVRLYFILLTTDSGRHLSSFDIFRKTCLEGNFINLLSYDVYIYVTLEIKKNNKSATQALAYNEIVISELSVRK